MSDHEDGYTGPATLHAGGAELAAHVRLDARHEPHDGRLHWFGRLRLDAGATLPVAAAEVELRTPTGRAAARIGDLDPWGRYRITGVGTPPYAADQAEIA
ncbi:MAG: DUF4873 domain-containing protein [Pseudonocardia sp.]